MTTFFEDNFLIITKKNNNRIHNLHWTVFSALKSINHIELDGNSIERKLWQSSDKAFFKVLNFTQIMTQIQDSRRNESIRGSVFKITYKSSCFNFHQK